jgi:hypothetical protein
LVRNAITKVRLTSAQILALNAAPITVLAAPGAGLVTVVNRVLAYKDAGTAYGGIAEGEDLAIRYTNGSGAIAAQIETTGFLDASGARTASSAQPGGLVTANAALVAHMLAGEVTTGTSDLILWIDYDIVPSALDLLPID